MDVNISVSTWKMVDIAVCVIGTTSWQSMEEIVKVTE